MRLGLLHAPVVVRVLAQASSPKADDLDLDNATRQLEQLVEDFLSVLATTVTRTILGGVSDPIRTAQATTRRGVSM